MDEKKTEQLQINLPVEIKDWLLEEAASKGISDDEFVNKVLVNYVKKYRDDNRNNSVNDEKSEYREIIDELLEMLRKF